MCINHYKLTPYIDSKQLQKFGIQCHMHIQSVKLSLLPSHPCHHPFRGISPNSYLYTSVMKMMHYEWHTNAPALQRTTKIVQVHFAPILFYWQLIHLNRLPYCKSLNRCKRLPEYLCLSNDFILNHRNVFCDNAVSH